MKINTDLLAIVTGEYYGIIYRAKNLVNGKVYVGQTVQTLKARVGGHKAESENINGKYRYNTYFYNAIRKYGIENFEWVIIIICKNKKEIDEFEDYCMEESYHSRDKKIGYNIKRAGSHGKHSEETRKKISEKHIGKKMSEESIVKRKNTIKKYGILSGENHWTFRLKKEDHPFFGRKLSKETKEKIGISNRGKKRSEEQKEKNRNSHIGKKLSEKQKRKISESNMGRVVTEETRKKIGNSNRGKPGLKGNKNPLWGTHLTDIQKNKMKEGKRKSDKIRKEKELQYLKKYINDGIITITQLSKIMKASRHKVSKYIKELDSELQQKIKTPTKIKMELKKLEIMPLLAKYINGGVISIKKLRDLLHIDKNILKKWIEDLDEDTKKIMKENPREKWKKSVEKNEKMGKWNIGKKHTKESKRKMSDSRKKYLESKKYNKEISIQQ